MEEKTARDILESQACIPQDQYLHLFQLDKLPRQFPSLKIGDDGIFTGESEVYDLFDTFELSKASYSYKLSRPDIEIEQCIIKYGIKQMRIDLRQHVTGTFSNHQCFVFPLAVASCSAVYDTLYLTDYLLKHMYRVLMAMLVHGASEECVKQETYMISMREIKGAYKVTNAESHYGFTRLVDLISTFICRNGLEEKQDAHKAEYEAHKKEHATMSASVSYLDIRYSLEDDTLRFKKLKPKIAITCWKGDTAAPIPPYAAYLNQFFEEYYDDIKSVFPVYLRLENMYRLCALNVVMDQFRPETEIHDSVYVDTYPRSILCSGGVLLAPTAFVQVPFKGHPIVDATQTNIDTGVCRKAFDNGGLLCAFAPKLQIRDCYNTNLKDFHNCLEKL